MLSETYLSKAKHIERYSRANPRPFGTIKPPKCWARGNERPVPTPREKRLGAKATSPGSETNREGEAVGEEIRSLPCLPCGHIPDHRGEIHGVNISLGSDVRSQKPLLNR